MKISFSVRSFLLLLAVSFTVPAIVIFAFFEARSGVETARERARETNRLAALLFQRDSDALVQELKAVTAGLAAGIDLDGLRFTHPERVKLVLQSYPGSAILVLNRAGVSVASYATDREIPVGIDYSDRAYVRDSLQTRIPVVSGPLQTRTTSVPVVVFCVPLLDVDGSVKGFLGGGIPAERFRPEYALPREQFAFLLDSEGHVISSVNSQPVDGLVPELRKAPAGDSRIDSGGNPVQLHVTELEPIGWKVVVGLPETYVAARTREAIYRAALVGLLCAFIGAAIATGVAFSTVRGVDSISQQIQRMSPVNLQPIQLSERALYPREARTLIGNFNQLLDRTARMRMAEFEAISRVVDTILIAEPSGQITYVNEAGTRISGDVVGKQLQDIIGPDIATKILVQQNAQEWKGDSRLKTNTGDVFDAFLSSTPILEDGKVSSVVVIVQDITREKAARDAFVQSEKMITLGELVAGTSHELNNPLAIVTGYADLLLEDNDLSGEQRSKIESIRKSALRASNVVHSLLAFARKRKPERVRTDVNMVIEAAIQLKEYDIRTSGIRLEKHLSDNVPAIYADPHQIQQVLLNVINNAQDAALDSRNVPAIVIRSEWSEGRVLIRIEDTGSGITKDDLKKVFDPFFTTKPLGKGTGLGLSISYGIIREHEGDISIQSQPGEGTQVCIDLPVGQPAETTPAIKIDRQRQKSSRKFLVVDDETEIVSIIKTALSRAGAKVDTASSVEDALGLAMKSEYDVVITDVKMPRGSGIDLYKQLCVLNPEYRRRVVFLTGDTNNPVTMQFIEREGLSYFAKPFDFQMFERFLTNVEIPVRRG